MTKLAPFAPLKPNLFQRRWNWHNRVLDFEKKYETILHPPVPRLVRPNARDVSQVMSSLVRDLSKDFDQEVKPAVKPADQPYKNRLYCATMRCGDLTEHLVSLVLDNSDDLYDDVEETKVFDTEQEALTCFHALQHIKTMYPSCALDVFKNY